MMRYSRLISLLGLLVGIESTRADAGFSACTGPSLSAMALRQISCIERDGLIMVHYVGASPSSPYATDFDRRSLFALIGQDTQAVLEGAGFVLSGKNRKGYRTKLVQPPEVDQIESRTPANGASKYKNWEIINERIQYFSQGGALGFVIDCTTAVKVSNETAAAIAECFPLEERARFFHTLDQVP